MKKQLILILTIIVVIGTFAATANAACYIEWTETLYNSAGSTETLELSKTEIAAEELFSYLPAYLVSSSTEQPYWQDQCYHNYDVVGYSIEFYKDVCLDGTFSYSDWSCYDGGPNPFGITPGCYYYSYDGTWDVVCDPTLVELSSLSATGMNRAVLIEWSTDAEIDNAGFNIYRSEKENGKYIRINDYLIPAKGSATQGASYEYTDKDVQNRKTYYYKLEDIDFNGTATMHGPVSATPSLINGLFQ